MKILLVEPEYYTRYPSLGLLKLASLHKSRGDAVEYVRGQHKLDFTPDLVYVTSLFTWDWKPVWQAVRHYRDAHPGAEVWLGGIYASLLPAHAKLSGAHRVWEGLFPEAEAVQPDYELVPTWKSTILFATRGCPRKCGFCSVPKLEGPPTVSEQSVRDLIYPDHTKAVFFDNNILGLPVAKAIFEELADAGVEVDFNQGMDVRFIDDEYARLISNMNCPIVRMAFDYAGIRLSVERGIQLLKDHGIRGRRMVFYVLYNYVDDPQDFFERVRDLLRWGVVVYPMRYEPLCTLEKGTYVSPQWTRDELDMVQRFRRVVGYGGALPPYKALLKKLDTASDFGTAFALRPDMKGADGPVPAPLVEMALEHQIHGVKNKDYFPSWRREKDWRKIRTTSSPGK